MLRSSLLLLAVAGLTLAAHGADRRDFDAPWMGYATSYYPNGIGPWASRCADLNGDGHLDLVTVSWPTNPELSVLLGDGAGRFAAPLLTPMPYSALDLELADVDGDGDLDAVVPMTGQVWEGFQFAHFRNDGTGRLTYAGAFDSGQGPNGITVNDFNGDGILDVAVAHDRYIAFGASIGVMYGKAAGGYQAPVIYGLESGTNKIASRDLDGDGRPDLVVAHENNRITVVHNGGSYFDRTALYDGLPSGFGDHPAVAIADIDADGDEDVLYSHSGSGDFSFGAVALYRNRGDGTLEAAERVDLLPGSGGATGLAVADVNGDGALDLLAALFTSQTWALVAGDGAGGFLAAREYRAGEEPMSIVTGDLDHDGTLDVVVACESSVSACVYRNPGAGAFVQPPVIDMVDPALAPASFSSLGTGDIDRDGDLDLVVGYSANFAGKYGISVRRNLGDGTFAARENYAQAALPVALVLRDLNGDGWLDVLWIDDGATPKFRYRLNNRDGTFGASTAGPGTYCSDQADIDAFDVDHDGRLDVVIGACYGSVYTCLNNGSGFAAPKVHAVTAQASAIASADLDRDGNLDLVTNSGVQGYVEVSLGNGDGTYQPPSTEVCGRGVRAIALGDLNGDSRPDIAAAYGLDGNGLTILIGRGDGSFKPATNYPGSYSTVFDNQYAIVLADADGDGDLDALVPNFGSQDLSVWHNRGDGTFDPEVRHGVGQQATDVAFGDFDGDSIADVAVLTGPDSPVSDWYYPGVIVLSGEPRPWNDLGHALAGTHGDPLLHGDGLLADDQIATVTLSNALEHTSAFLIAGLARWDLPFLGGVLVPSTDWLVRVSTGASGGFAVSFAGPPGLPAGIEIFMQFWIFDPAAVRGMAASNALLAVSQ